MQRRRKSISRCWPAGDWRRICSRSVVRCRWLATRPRTGLLDSLGPNLPKFEDTETTVDQLKERIAKTVAYLKTLDTKAIDAAPEREITFPLGQNKGQMKGGDYLNHFVLPNFYFHLTAAYAVVRNFGVDVGKRDFLGAIPLKRI